MDTDGLATIHRGHGRSWQRDRDPFFESAAENSLELFSRAGIEATYFVIASDLDDLHKRRSLEAIVAAGHRVACHGLHHRYLDRISTAHKREEIVDARKKIEDALGAPCLGFRAPGFAIDRESLTLLAEAGYRYDSSIFPSFALREKLGLQRLFREPFEVLPGRGLIEVPMPYVGPGLPMFHPCYAFYLRRPYFRWALRRFAARQRHLTLLFHFTDFATPQPDISGLRMALFTNNLFSRTRKLAFCERLVRDVREHFSPTTTEAFLEGWPEQVPDLCPRTVLGISTTHETGACVTRDGEILSAINEERLTRFKLDNRYPPEDSIREAIRLAGIRPEEIDAVAVAGLEWTDLLPQTWRSFREDVADFQAWNDYFPHLCRIFYRLFYFWRALGYRSIERHLEREYGIRPPVRFVEHHEAHASSAYRTQPRDRALIVTADGVGDDVCISFSYGEGAAIWRRERFFYPNSFGQFYTACTQILGFKAGRHEGKITGLSGYGKPDPSLILALEQTLSESHGFRLGKRYYAEGFPRPGLRTLRDLLRGRFHLYSVEYRNYKAPLRKLLAGHPRENVAFAFQTLLEREMLRLVRRHAPEAPFHLVLAGGLFANVKLNMALSEALRPASLWVFPNMGDGGLCVGAALALRACPPAPVRDMFLGSRFSAEVIEKELEGCDDLVVEAPADLEERIASELAEGRIVARFAGRMEFGPRALGHRSILYHCGDPTVNDWLNTQLHRTEFMPFAPICRMEDADEYFELQEGERRTAEFMTLVVRCREVMKQTCPAAVHVDGTARPQLVRREVSPGMHAILSAYRRRTGIGCLINTSFNMHEEPIVRSPADAIRAFRLSGLDGLALGPFLVRRAGESATAHPVQ
ncbi:MAG: carbamoyltransferase C-terminal domain-containing protein [Myxococcota bacterium]